MGYLACEECSEADIWAVGPSGSTLIYIVDKEETGELHAEKNRVSHDALRVEMVGIHDEQDGWRKRAVAGRIEGIAD